MILGREIAARLAVPAVALVATVPAAVHAGAPVLAHGAPQSPLSRAAACGPDSSGTASSAACRAAVAAGFDGGQWDNIRVAGVAGRDREVVASGRMCSAGLPRYWGLDLARADWPATRLESGAEYTFSYRATIPHQGSFRMYITTDDYAPTRPLSWADLEEEPFLAVTDPPLRDGAYQIAGRLPSGKEGRHLIYTIWQNSDTPDTYYSCSDVVFGAAADPAVSPAAEVSGAGVPGASEAAAGRGASWLAVTAVTVAVVAAIVLVLIPWPPRRPRAASRRGTFGRHR